MYPKRQDTKWNGVTHDPERPRSYRAWIKTGYKMVRLGDWYTPMEAVLAADFARYIVWGVDATKWYNHGCHRMQEPPNTVPQVNLPFDIEPILTKLRPCVKAITMADNLAAYMDMAAKLAASGNDIA